MEHHIRLSGQTLVITAYRSANDLLDGVTDPDDLPFWAELWPAAEGLARFLWRADLRGRRVLELGAGTGLAGIAAALRGARVVQTDFVPAALQMARYNALRNGAGEIEHRLADWRDFPDLGLFDLILGADILYEPRVHEPLRRVCRAHLASSGRLLLADPGRAGAETFVLSLEALGWSWNLTQEVLAAESGSGEDPGPRPAAIDIFELFPPTPAPI